jgi:hypothetical protein
MKLLHPDDPQDIPHAVELILAIIECLKLQHTIATDLFSVDIETHTDLQSIILLSALLESIVLPFTDISLSLSKQVTLLSCYCHLAFAFSMPIDAHLCHINCIITLRPWQRTLCSALAALPSNLEKLNSHAPFFLGDVRDDPLKILSAAHA